MNNIVLGNFSDTIYGKSGIENNCFYTGLDCLVCHVLNLFLQPVILPGVTMVNDNGIRSRFDRLA